MKILLPDNISLDPVLPEGVVAHVYDVKQPIPDQHLDAEVLVAWGNGRRSLRDAAERMTNLRLVQGLAAGPDSLFAAGFSDDVQIASGVGLHNETVAEHALALLLSLVRRLPASRDAQARHEWSTEIGGIQPLHPENAPITTLMDARVLIWGFGSIGQTLAKLLTPLGASVRGVARSTGLREGYEVIAQDQIGTALPYTDALVMILPSSDATESALGAEELESLPDTAYVLNVGRGTTVDEDALRAALENGSIAGAALDVTRTEPLPADSPLWDAPNLLITPHAAGGRPVHANERISENVAALLEDRPLTNLARK